MKSGEYTTTVTITLDDEREFDVQFTSSWANDGIGRYEYGSAVCFDKGHNYLEQVNNWKIESETTKEERKAIEKYINDNEESILERMSDQYDPYWDLSV